MSLMVEGIVDGGMDGSRRAAHGGIAYGFNNLLMVVGGNAALLGEKSSGDVVHRRALAIMRAVERGERLTRQLLTFSRRQMLRPEPVDLRQRVHEISEMLSRSLRGNIELCVDIPENLWPVMRAPSRSLPRMSLPMAWSATSLQ